jgi:putative ABC transport system ATP-binding protein
VKAEGTFPPPAPSAPVLQMRAVTKSFATPRGPVHVLRGVDVTIEPGRFVAITGPSGSGKSTFLNLASLLDTPTSGEVFFDGNDVSFLPERELCAVRKDRIGMVFQKFCLLPHRSAIENVLFRFRYLDVPAAEARRRAEEALATVGLAGQADQPVRLMSGGEMQRVAIARAVAQRPRLIVADEPTGNLDREAAEAVMNTFARLHADGIAILLVTHNEALLRYSERHLVCREGRLEERAP